MSKIEIINNDFRNCQIPEEIIKRIIIITAKPQDTIIDVFAGSGTTNKVALELGFDTIAYEIDKTYINIIKERTNEISYTKN